LPEYANHGSFSLYSSSWNKRGKKSLLLLLPFRDNEYDILNFYGIWYSLSAHNKSPLLSIMMLKSHSYMHLKLLDLITLHVWLAASRIHDPASSQPNINT